MYCCTVYGSQSGKNYCQHSKSNFFIAELKGIQPKDWEGGVGGGARSFSQLFTFQMFNDNLRISVFLVNLIARVGWC
jgi:hypothetical protein